uniref:1-alkyl-2-acetylglycerophosphocholine esterase n=1 Tax=Phallusia mammillata TaxID=59560 RepID=A0A6F9DNC0_9ASCI|nr:platelet-activating factor acetylhydrolase 2, cytoplasmic-like [Phallusia mammillata]
MPNFPEPSGPYSVGCSDVLSKLGEDRCFFRLFYPACIEETSKKTHWLPSTEYSYNSWIFRCFTSSARINAVMNADLDNRVNGMPVVVFSHGDDLCRNDHSHTCIELASKGMLVASVEHGDRSAKATYYLQEDANDNTKYKKIWIPYIRLKDKRPSDHEIRNKQVRRRALECNTALEHIEEINNGTFKGVANEINFVQFKGKVDVEKAAVMGHSFGGATAVAAFTKVTKFKVGVALDAWMPVLDKEQYQDVADKPFLFINSFKDFQTPETIASMRNLDGDTFGIDAERKIVTIKDSHHLTQIDLTLLAKWSWFTRMCELHGPVDPHKLTKANDDLIAGFIGKHLGLDFGAELDEVVKKHEQCILVGSNVAVNEEVIKSQKDELRSTASQ